MRISVNHPETIAQAKFFESVVMPRCTAIICDERMRLQAIEMAESDYFWMMVGILWRDDEQDED